MQRYTPVSGALREDSDGSYYRVADVDGAKAVDAFGGYRLDDDIRDAIQAHLRVEDTP